MGDAGFSIWNVALAAKLLGLLSCIGKSEDNLVLIPSFILEAKNTKDHVGYRSAVVTMPGSF